MANSKWDALSKDLHFNNQDKVMWCGGFKHGLLEIIGDKKFGVNEVVELCKILISNPFEKCGKTYQDLTDSYIQSLQQTEWDVEIITEDTGLGARINRKPKLDRDSCLILKRI